MLLVMVCSSILQHRQVNETGRQLAGSYRWRFLKTAETLPCFQSSGTRPVCSVLLITIVRIWASSSEHSLRIRAGIMSGPVAFCGLLFCSSFLTPCSVTVILSTSGKGVPSGSGMAELGSSRV